MVFLTSLAELALLDVKQFTDNTVINRIHDISTFEHQCSTSLVQCPCHFRGVFFDLLSFWAYRHHTYSYPYCINRLTPNDPYIGRTAPLTSKRCILYIYSTNIGTEYFKHALYSPFFSFQTAVCFIMLTCLVPVLFTFYIQGVLKFKEIILAPKG